MGTVRAWGAIAAAWLPLAVAAQTVTELPPVPVPAMRLDIPLFDLPAALSSVPVRAGADGKPGVNLSEVLTGVPGVLARDRQDYAQDEQLSIRGFGARASFGVRGVRLYADGIPATMPDGQGQVSHFALAAADRVEVLRGPFSALYGNSSGGVVQLWSAEGGPVPERTLEAYAGADASLRLGGAARGIAGPLNYSVALGHFRTDGYRAHSRAQRTSGNARLAFDLGEGRTLTVVANTLAQPQAQDPLGLTRDQWRADPRQAVEAAFAFDTRKRLQQQQLGAVWEARGDRQDVRLMGYGGRRGVTQVLAIPPAAQQSPLSAGGVVDLDGGYGGADARWTRRGRLFGRPLELVLGTSWDAQDQHRRGYENFVGDALGVQGALRRNELDRVHAFDQYAQLYWRLAPHWSLLLGARHSVVTFRASDRYLTAGNPDDSGRTRYRATTPVAGIDYRPSTALRLYTSYGEGFETPTFNELGYRRDGQAGLALDLRPVRSRSGELGLKWRTRDDLQVELALFRADSRDELAVASNYGGRSTYRNVGRSRRQGAELSLDGELGDGWRLRLGMTWLQARFRTGFLACAATPCRVPDLPVPAGTRVPGVPDRYGSLRLERGGDLGWRGGLELEGVGAVPVDDRNSAVAPGYVRTGVDVGYGIALGEARMHLIVRVDNLFDRRTVGSVIVNDGNGRYYEPAPGRSVLIGMRLDM
ncbi:TonB-dependent receptor family protein [Frateuria terrea]|uniref:Iron complex outermembrane recepter protein n=1 Tax=Frateuria terrea TaxID=529704 RepID=A0A1H6WZF6_9GAMM|nr:TonB-dependent receptor [Frateuria terrea]SEJ19717.1 iron complex outermembrane recepter protein [Frateuria terrea]SFP57493.1 iron complex outermembrane recepter protein [Frateuria terrea]